MKLKLCFVALVLSATLVACKSNKNESVDLLAPVAGTEELASNEQTQDNANETINTEDESVTEEYNSEEERLASEWIKDSINNHEYSKEQSADALNPTIAETNDSLSNSNTLDGQVLTTKPDGTNQTTKDQEPTKVPGEMNHPSDTPVPTNTPGVTDEPSNTPVPTKAPGITNKPSNTPVPTKVPGETIKPSNTPAPTKAPGVTIKPTNTPVPTKEPTPTNGADETSSAVLNVRGTTVSMGESKDSILDKFGSPSRIDETEYNYDFYVYKGNYKNFMMIGIANNKVVAWYTDSNDFSYQGVSTTSNVSKINSTFGKSLSLKSTLSITSDGKSITFFMDTLGNSTIDGIYVADSSVSKGSTTKSVLTAWEKEVFDLTNSFRARNGLSALTWSDEASKSARLHSEDMAKNNYFSHTGLDGSTPFDRMKAQGISYKSAGENIIGGYGNAMHSYNGWVNSSGHRTNLLNSSFNHLGVGFALGGTYGNYGTQNFFGK